MSSPYGRMVLICNSRAGRGGLARALPAIEAHLHERELEYELQHTEGPGHATVLARAAIQQGVRLVVAVGGDGTIHEVLNGMIENDVALNPEAHLGVVAASTGSDFIKTFGIPPTPSHAVVHLDGPEAFPIDVGKVTFTEGGRDVVRYFANVAEVGIGADVMARAQKLPRFLGPTVYFLAFWLTIRKHVMTEVVVDLVDRTYEGPMNNLVVANCQFFGGGMKIAPKAAPTDGLLDIQIEHARKREEIAVMPKVYKGQHVPHPDIFEAKRVRASITSDRPLRVEADGEVLGYSPATFEVLRNAISLKV
jgi:diacylglycerol kinase (ATP)